ncbi:hypothetical protein SpCBS45565_g03794 [Spizellomyces sp. 'palustris']|nr:hypothetical protein SpCBS45565_g03794 [Spizellomyces sp. 'palustris']
MEPIHSVESVDDPYLLYPELAVATPPTSRIRRLVAYDWANGFVSPFRETPTDVCASVAEYLRLHSLVSARDSLLDLGCGNGALLFGVVKALGPVATSCFLVGVDLDQKLVEEAAKTATEDGIIRSQRVQLFVGDIVSRNPVFQVHPRLRSNIDGISMVSPTTTVDTLLDDASVILLYLLPEAIGKLLPNLRQQILLGKLVISIKWPLTSPDLDLSEFLCTHQDGYLVYRRSIKA